MKKIAVGLLALVLSIGPAMANGYGHHGHGGYSHGGYGRYIAPLIIGGAIGYAVAPRPVYSPPPVYQTDPYYRPNCTKVIIQDEYGRFIREEVRCPY